MCVKFTPKDLNFGPYFPHLTNIYTCGVTIALRVYGGKNLSFHVKLSFINSISIVFIVIYIYIYIFFFFLRISL